MLLLGGALNLFRLISTKTKQGQLFAVQRKDKVFVLARLSWAKNKGVGFICRSLAGGENNEESCGRHSLVHCSPADSHDDDGDNDGDDGDDDDDDGDDDDDQDRVV